jgi:phosphatidylglycerophosphatase A
MEKSGRNTPGTPGVQPNLGKTLSKIFATFFGAGLSPRAPGTVATFAAIPLYLALRSLRLPFYLAITAKLFAAGALAAREMEKEWGRDPSKVVIDEVVGLLITLVSRPRGIKEILIGSALFRFFDILKPPPVSTLERKVPGGLGVMADDVAAGIMAALCLAAARRAGWTK